MNETNDFDIPEQVQNAIDGEIENVHSATCDDCGTTVYAVSIADGEIEEVDECGRSNYIMGLEDNYVGDGEAPMMCQQCEFSLRSGDYSSTMTGVLPSGERTYANYESECIFDAYWQSDTSYTKTLLADAMDEIAADGFSAQPELDGEPMDTIELSDERRKELENGEITGCYAIVTSWVWATERDADVLFGRTEHREDEPPTPTKEDVGALRIDRSDERFVRVSHAATGREAGFDLTDFGSPEAFQAVLESVGLDRFADFHRVEGELSTTFVWCNDHALIVTGNHPFTGEYSMGDHARDPEPGYASYIGIEGEPDAVDALVKAVDEHAEFIKGFDRESRGFI